ncbi:MAG: transglutaminase family protein [Phaeodactylibacter sp.]|uniref:transglutaminase-like domain-containing protein n=1 Tax=Phaeodactylibacter sp. TaxID=1940289 RepID=UPI0032ECB6BF
MVKRTALEENLQPTVFYETYDPALLTFVNRVVKGARSPIAKAVKLYYAVRDGWRYNPYDIRLEPDALKVSALLPRSDGHCIDKAILLIAACRAVGIPARLCLSKVRNHIAAERMTAAFGTDVLVPHGYAELWLNGKWVKATPAFNKGLCDRLGVAPLEFDGHQDSLFQEFDHSGGTFMEYLEDYGAFADVPLQRMRELMQAHYPEAYANYLKHGQLMMEN